MKLSFFRESCARLTTPDDCARLPTVAGRRCSFKRTNTRSPSTLPSHRWIIPSLIHPLSLFGLRIGYPGWLLITRAQRSDGVARRSDEEVFARNRVCY